MNKIEEIAFRIERNSKKISEYTSRIQELRVKLDKIESQIKWAPAVDLTVEDKQKITYPHLIDLMPCESNYPSGRTRTVAEQAAVERNVRELQDRRNSIKRELDYVINLKEGLRKENLALREKIQFFKQNQNN